MKRNGYMVRPRIRNGLVSLAGLAMLVALMLVGCLLG